jgi:hypothetical protein
MRGTVLLLLGSLVLAPTAALADSQSANSSSNCSNGRCSRVDSVVIQDRWGHWGWVREQSWRERGERRDRQDRDWRGGWYGWQPHGYAPRHGRGRDDKD